MKTKGFTLIELLVVVLIIGILAAIAVPKYFRIVEKAKFAQLIPTVNAVEKALKDYIDVRGWPVGEGTVISGAELRENFMFGFEGFATNADGALCNKDFIISYECNRNQWNAKCSMQLKRMPNRIAADGTCKTSGYPYYVITYLYSDQQWINVRNCDAYEIFIKRYYPGREGVPTEACNQAVAAGLADKMTVSE